MASIPTTEKLSPGHGRGKKKVTSLVLFRTDQSEGKKKQHNLLSEGGKKGSVSHKEKAGNRGQKMPLPGAPKLRKKKTGGTGSSRHLEKEEFRRRHKRCACHAWR